MKIVNNFFTKRTGFGFLMVFSTLSISVSAAYYSIYGLSSLFAGAKTEVMIMASALELAKIVIASYLHNNWKSLGILLKSYLTTGVFILMIITSAGIYGFLTAAYQQTADQLGIVDMETAVYTLKKDRFTEQVVDYKSEKEQLNKSITELSLGLSSNVITYTDKTGNLVTTTSSATRKVLTEQLNESKQQRDKLSIKIESLTDSITKIDLTVFDIQSNNELIAEIGPLRFLSKITGKPMDTIVNWFTLLIVLVFDPLAVAMVIAINKYIGGNTNVVELTQKEEEMSVVVTKPIVVKEPKKVKIEKLHEVDKKTLYGETTPNPTGKDYGDSTRKNEGL
jgi:Skp family chaperone for outer membrane proteins